MEDIVGLRLVFNDMTIKNVDITPDWVKWLWTSPEDQLNVTIIEFSPTALTVLSRMQFSHLISAAPLKTAKVTLYYYSGENACGSIIDIVEDCIQYNINRYRLTLGSPEISLGSPLLNEDRHVVGIHVGLWESTTESAQTTCKAINIQSILTAFKNYVLKMLNGKIKNELWQERINQIPLNEWELIGSGGYGQVYKIKMKTDLNELAVKIVQGFGKLSDYDAQVRALTKEYAMVTALENNPRIVQFFTFFRDDTKVRLLLVMELLKGGSLADRLNDQQPLSNDAVLKYLKQILEGVDFLHQRNIFHSDIKPANILFNEDDDVKLCDFGIAVELLTESSATTSHIKGDLHYMSPERLDNMSSRSAANDIWSIGATFVQMISGQKINHQETFPQFVLNIIQYKILINGILYDEFLKTLREDDFKRIIISRTLCKETERINCKELLSIVRAYLPLQLSFLRRIPKQTLIRAGETDPDISGMSYNSARYELFLADRGNGVVREMFSRDDAGDLRDVYRAPHDTSQFIRSVCHMSDSDTLLVCCLEEYGPDRNRGKWLVALSRNGSEWREAQRVHTRGIGWISCALSESRVLIGEGKSMYMELFRVESGPRIACVHRIHVPETYEWFSATCGSNTLVAMTYPTNQSVSVHRLRSHRLEELAFILLKWPEDLLWIADRLLVADFDREKSSHAIIELEVSGKQLKHRRELIATNENINVSRLCAVNDGLAIFDENSRDILHYSFV